MKKIIVWSILLVLCVSSLPCHGEDSCLKRAMSDELHRSMELLKLDAQPKPYFLSYMVRDYCFLGIRADSGAITDKYDLRGRALTTGLRVGDYSLDNTHFDPGSSWTYTGPWGELPIDDNYDVLRRRLWLETDRLYKIALELMTKKKAYLQNKIRTETLPDFTRGEAFSFAKPSIPLVIDRKEQLTQLTRSIAKYLAESGNIEDSTVICGARRENVYYVNSDGVSGVEPRQSCWLSIVAETHASDGMPLRNFLQYKASSPEGLPEPEKIKTDTAVMIRDLKALKNAPLAENYSGPVLFEKQAAAEIMARGFVKALAAKRVPESSKPEDENDTARLDNPLQSKAGARVIGGAATVAAEPTKNAFKGLPLLASYGVDEEGVKARDVVLVEKGVLKNLMTSRSPVKGFDTSNGHYRGISASPGVVAISSEKTLSQRELKEKMLAMLKDENLKYGYLVRTIVPPDLQSGEKYYRSQSSGLPSEFQLTSPVLVYRVYPDGKEELVRGAEFGRMNVRLFKDIVALADDPVVYNYPYNAYKVPVDAIFPDRTGPGSGYYTTVITPSLLFSEVDMNKPAGKYSRPPIVPQPGIGK